MLNVGVFFMTMLNLTPVFSVTCSFRSLSYMLSLLLKEYFLLLSMLKKSCIISFVYWLWWGLYKYLVTC